MASSESPDARHNERRRIPLAQMADHVIELHAGPERSVAATKTYTAQLTVMALLAATWNGEADHLAELQTIPDALARTLAGVPDRHVRRSATATWSSAS